MKKYLPILLILTSANLFAQKTEFTSQDALSIRIFDIQEVSESGEWIAGKVLGLRNRLNIDHFRFGDPSYVPPYTSELLLINSDTGEKRTIEPSNSIIGPIAFSPNEEYLAYLKYENKEYQLYVHDIGRNRTRLTKLKDERALAPVAGITWTRDNQDIIISLRSANWAEKGAEMYKEATEGPITIYDADNPFLKWEEIRRHYEYAELSRINLSSGNVYELLPESTYDNIKVSEDNKVLSFSEYHPKSTSYNRKGGIDIGLFSININQPETRDTLISFTEKRLSPNWDITNTKFAYADSSHIYVGSLVEPTVKRVTPDTTEIVKNDTIDVEFSLIRWRPDSKAVLAASKSGYWQIDLVNDEIQKVFDFPEDPKTAPSLEIIHWTEDGNSLYMTYSEKKEWNRGIVRYDIASKEFTNLIRDENGYDDWRVSKDGNKFFYSFSDGISPNNTFVANADFTTLKQLTDLNPWTENKKLPKTELVNYRDADGNELTGVLYYPVDYEEGKKYPLVCEIYETFFDNNFNLRMTMLTNAGYFGFKPSVNLEIGYPNEAWIKGVTSGINKLIDRGLVDENKLGVQGVSYGGYATSLLISQTDRFAAAINISGKTNIISFLGDSPRIGTRNYAAAEVGQDRIGETLWEAPLKYINTSAVMFADRINTPHLLLTGEGDWNVSALNTRELYYALRRLDKDVVWVNYQKAGHGAGFAGREEDFHDMWSRMINWYDKYFEKADDND